MFKIDDDIVVDATLRGNAARFINHSCDPNCYSKIVDIFGKKHIIIFANRKIIPGEELTYDYKFPIEDEKIRYSTLCDQTMYDSQHFIPVQMFVRQQGVSQIFELGT